MTAILPGPAETDRGTLTITDRTVERIAARALAEVSGVDSGRPAKVSVSQSGDAVLDVRLSISYPLSVSRTTSSARSHVTSRVEELTGVVVSRVDITVVSLTGNVEEARRVQ